MEKRGSQGGKTTVKRHGKPHMAAIGRKGFDTTVARHFGGDAASYTASLRERAHESQIDALADIQLRGELAGGKAIASVELLADEEYEPQSWRERVSTRSNPSPDLPW